MRKLLAVVALSNAVPAIGLPVGRGADPTDTVSLKDLPDFHRRGYQVDPYIAAAAKIQAMGEEKGPRMLMDLANDQEHGEKAIVLCRMLFVPRPHCDFRRPLIGAP